MVGRLNAFQRIPSLLLGLHLGAGPVLGLAGSAALVGWIGLGHGTPSPWTWAFLLVGLSLGLFPSNTTMLASGAAFGWLGAPVLFLALVAASLPGFLVIRHRFRDEIRDRAATYPAASLILEVLDSHGWSAATLLRIAPISTFAWTNALLAVSLLSLPRFLLTTAVGIAPRILLLTWAGGSALDVVAGLKNGQLAAAPLIALFLSLGSLAGLGWIAAGVLRKAQAPASADPGNEKGR